jgi:hypothetical protein
MIVADEHTSFKYDEITAYRPKFCLQHISDKCALPLRWRVLMPPDTPRVYSTGDQVDASGCPNKPPAMVNTGGVAVCLPGGKFYPRPRDICVGESIVYLTYSNQTTIRKIWRITG